MTFEENAQNYEVFWNIVKRPNVIGEGSYNFVLGLSNRYVAKVPIEPSYDLESEYRNQVELYFANLPVAKPLGIFRFYPECYRGEFGIGLVMDRINGIRGNETKHKTRIRVEEELDKTLDKCKRLGFNPYDTGLHNCIWDPKQEKLYLIDFIGWEQRH